MISKRKASTYLIRENNLVYKILIYVMTHLTLILKIPIIFFIQYYTYIHARTHTHTYMYTKYSFCCKKIYKKLDFKECKYLMQICIYILIHIQLAVASSWLSFDLTNSCYCVQKYSDVLKKDTDRHIHTPHNTIMHWLILIHYFHAIIKYYDSCNYTFCTILLAFREQILIDLKSKEGQLNHCMGRNDEQCVNKIPMWYLT